MNAYIYHLTACIIHEVLSLACPTLAVEHLWPACRLATNPDYQNDLPRHSDRSGEPALTVQLRVSDYAP